MKGTWQTDGGGGGNWSAASQIPEVLAVVGIGVVVINFVMWVFHYLIDALTVTGLVAVVGTVVWAVVKWKRRQPSLPPPWQQPVQAAQPRQPVGQPQPQQALPAGSVHHHYGHSLVLPDSVSGEDLAKLFRKTGD